MAKRVVNLEEEEYLRGFISEQKFARKNGPLSRGKGKKNRVARESRKSGETRITNRVVKNVEKPR